MFTISLSDKSIRFLETNKDKKICFAHQVTDNFELENIITQNKLTDSYINRASDEINKVLKSSGTSAHTAKLVFETGQCFANVIPLDFSENKEKISSNILWELSNYFPEDYKNYKINYHRLLTESLTETIKETLIIAVKSSKLEAVKKLSGRIDIKINSIDIEHFSAEKYFRAIRKELITEENIVVMGCKRNRIDYSIINNKGCFAYSFITIDDDSAFQENLAKAYINFEKKYKNLDIKNIYLYGDEMTSTVYKTINDSSVNGRVILSNPFYEIGITDKVNTDIVSEGYKFTPLCGILIG